MTVYPNLKRVSMRWSMISQTQQEVLGYAGWTSFDVKAIGLHFVTLLSWNGFFIYLIGCLLACPRLYFIFKKVNQGAVRFNLNEKMVRLFPCGHSDQVHTSNHDWTLVNLKYASIFFWLLTIDHSSLLATCSAYKNCCSRRGKFHDCGSFTNTTDTVPSWAQGPWQKKETGLEACFKERPPPDLELVNLTKYQQKFPKWNRSNMSLITIRIVF